MYKTLLAGYSIVSLPLLLTLLLTAPTYTQETQPLLPIVSIQEQLPTPAVKFSYAVEQKKFLTTKSALIYQLPDSTVIEIAADDVPVVKQGVSLSIEGLIDTEIEINTLLDFNGITVGVFPPTYAKPVSNFTYHLLGKVGDRFGVRARSSEGLKTIIVEIKGTKPEEPPPVDPPPTDLSNLSKIVSVSVTTLDDRVTQSAIKEQLNLLLSNFPKTIEEAKSALGKSIAEGLLISMETVRPPYKDWKGGFRVPIDSELVRLNISTAEQLKQAVQAIVNGM